MHSTQTKTLLACFLLGVLTVFTACEKAVEATPAVSLDLQFVALTKDLVLQTYNANDLTRPIKSVQVSGLISAETIFGIDYRPATGQLYALGNTSTLYTINTNTGQATLVGPGPFQPAVSGMILGFDFNPTVDRIRVVTSTGQNLRLNPETGTVQNTDGPVAGAMISGAAYTNNFSGATSTVLFDIDVVAKKLFRQDPPNNGTLVEVGSLTIPTSMGESGFDIAPNGTALAAVSNGGNSSLYQIDLTSGASTLLGAFADRLIGIAIPTIPNPVAYAVDDLNNLIIFNPFSASRTATIPLTNLGGTSIEGLDIRPATGQLYGLGRNSRLYTINTATGVATPVGMAPFSPGLSLSLGFGTYFGFDFNPTVDRIRVVSNTGQNLRLNPITGEVAAVDSSLNPGTPLVTAAAYTNNFAGATTTTLYVIDIETDRLLIQNPPNNGVLVNVGDLGVNAMSANGFDIGGTSGIAYAILTVSGVTNVYTINLTTGVATAGVTFERRVLGFTVGLGL